MSCKKRDLDTIVIGGGLAGLSCAALLSKAGLRVSVLEKNHRLGGYAVTYTKNGHRFDIAVQAVGGCDAHGAVGRLLSAVGQEDRVRFLPCEPARVYYFDDSAGPWLQPGTWDDLVEGLCNRFPEHGKTLRACYDTWSGILDELERIGSDPSAAPRFTFSRNYPLLSRYSDHTLEQFFNEYDLPKGIQQLVSARSGYCMVPPHRLSLVGFACTEASFRRGAWVVEGGIGGISQALVRAISDNAGRVQRQSKVNSIITEQGRIQGVRTDDGQVITAQSVVIAAPVRPALENWLDQPDLIPQRYRTRLSRMEATGSYYIAYYGVRTEAVQGLWPNMEVRHMGWALWGKQAPDTYYVLIPSLVDPTAAPTRAHSLCLSIPCPPGVRLDAEGRIRCRRVLEQAVEKRFPQLRNRLTFLFDLGPDQLEKTTGNPGGSAYGWAQTPQQAGIKRLNLKTPVPGLYLAGQWTMPGGGIAGVVTSGRLCAQAILHLHEKSEVHPAASRGASAKDG